LKGGVREVIASEALHRLGVTTSRTLSLIETLWEAIDQRDDWQPYGDWLNTVMGRDG
jgi:uncharacterized protein YdiU (UPF0061 family)